MERRVLFLANDAGKYGANQSLINIVSSLKDKDIFVFVVFPVNGGICEIFDENNVNYSIVKYRTELCSESNRSIDHFTNFLRNLRKIWINAVAIKVLADVVKSNRINIIHSNSSVLAIGSDLSKRVNVRHVWHLREHIHPNFKMFVFGGLEKYKRRIRDEKNLICVSKGVANGFNLENCVPVMYDAVRREAKFSKPTVKNDYFLFCGSIDRNKGIEEALEAFHRVFAMYPNFRLLVAGEGALEYENYVKEKVKVLGLSNSVYFLGFRNDVDDLMHHATAFLMCSRNEALGRVTIEAMMNFCLVIGYNDSGTAEIIDHGKTGFLYNNIEELVSTMTEVIRNYESYCDVLSNANKFSTNGFLESRYSENLLDYYDRLF
jgi:glycosyltransferase involved in cell wall biosynthesis